MDLFIGRNNSSYSYVLVLCLESRVILFSYFYLEDIECTIMIFFLWYLNDKIPVIMPMSWLQLVQNLKEYPNVKCVDNRLQNFRCWKKISLIRINKQSQMSTPSAKTNPFPLIVNLHLWTFLLSFHFLIMVSFDARKSYVKT